MENQNPNNSISVNNQNTLAVKANVEALFSGDSYGLFVFKKTEKIVTAIYLLTGLMSDNEPMKMRLRDLATILLENSIAMSDRVWGEETFQKHLSTSIYEITRFLMSQRKQK